MLPALRGLGRLTAACVPILSGAALLLSASGAVGQAAPAAPQMSEQERALRETYKDYFAFTDRLKRTESAFNGCMDREIAKPGPADAAAMGRQVAAACATDRRLYLDALNAPFPKQLPPHSALKPEALEEVSLRVDTMDMTQAVLDARARKTSPLLKGEVAIPPRVDPRTVAWRHIPYGVLKHTLISTETFSKNPRTPLLLVMGGVDGASYQMDLFAFDCEAHIFGSMWTQRYDKDGKLMASRKNGRVQDVDPQGPLFMQACGKFDLTVSAVEGDPVKFALEHSAARGE